MLLRWLPVADEHEEKEHLDAWATRQSASLERSAMELYLLRCATRCREWADIAAELHRRDQYWILADIIAELVPIGRAAVEAQKAVFDYYGPALVSSPFKPYTATSPVDWGTSRCICADSFLLRCTAAPDFCRQRLVRVENCRQQCRSTPMSSTKVTSWQGTAQRCSERRALALQRTCCAHECSACV